MIAGWIKRISGTASLRKQAGAVEIAVDDSGILKFHSPDGGDIQAVDTLHTQTVAGAKTFSGANTHSGAATFSAATDGLRRSISTTSAATITVTASQSGIVFICTASSGTQVFTLPTAATAGLEYTFIADNAGGEILINPAASQTITCKASEGGAVVAPAAGTGIKNTAATNVQQDHITLVSDGGTAWRMIAQSGTWASQ